MHEIGQLQQIGRSEKASARRQYRKGIRGLQVRECQGNGRVEASPVAEEYPGFGQTMTPSHGLELLPKQGVIGMRYLEPLMIVARIGCSQ